MAEAGPSIPEPPRRRKRGRKQLAPELARRSPVTVRLTESELALVDERRGELPRGDYLRRAALKTPPRPIPAINREAWTELARLAGNLNQVARAVNAGRLPLPNEIDLAGLQRAVAALRMELLGGTLSEPDEPKSTDEEAQP